MLSYQLEGCLHTKHQQKRNTVTVLITQKINVFASVQ